MQKCPDGWEQRERLLDNPQIRAGFVRKVYGILTAQLSFTLATVGVAVYVPQSRVVFLNPVAYVGASAAAIVSIFGLFCLKRRHPWNLCLLGLFTVCESMTLATACSVYAAFGLGNVVVLALALTSIVFGSLSAYVHVSRRDFDFLGAGLGIGVVVLVSFSVFCIIFPTMALPGLFGAVGTMLFSGYILYDTSEIIHRMEVDNYVEGAVDLYLDVINLFVSLLDLLRCLLVGDE